MFIKDDDFVDIKIFYKIKGHSCDVYTDKEFELIKNDENDKKKFKVLNLKMRRLTWGLYNSLQEDAIVSSDSGSGDRRFNFKVYKENRLVKLIKEWDAQDDNGKAVPVNEQNVGHLIPSIAETILRAYDTLSLLGDEEEKK